MQDEDLLKDAAAADGLSSAADDAAERAEDFEKKVNEIAGTVDALEKEAADAVEDAQAEAADAVETVETEVTGLAEEAVSEAESDVDAVKESAEEALRKFDNAENGYAERAADTSRVIEKASNKTTAVLIAIIAVLVVLIVIFAVIIGKRYYEANKSNSSNNSGTDTENTVATPTTAATDTDVNGTEEGRTIREYDVTVELGQYKGLEIDFPEITVDEEDVDSELEYFVEDLAEEVPVNRPSQNGDNMNIDYVGYMDGVEFEGGKDENVDIVVGEGMFFDAFDEALVGKEPGEYTLDLTFPEEYYEDMAGKPVTFVVTINSVTETVIPELTDELVAANTEYSNVEEYRAYIKGTLEEEATQDAEEHLDRDIMYMAIENATFGGEIDTEINDLAQQYFDYYDQMAQSYYGVSGTELFAMFYGMTEEDYNATIMEESSYSVKLQHLLDKVAETENIGYTEEEYKTEFEEIFFSYYGFTEEAEVKEQLTDEEIDKIVISSIKQRKAQELIIDNTKINR